MTAATKEHLRNHLGAAEKRKFEEPQNRIRSVVKLGTFGAILEYGVEKKVTKHSTLGATMVVGIPVGVTLRIKVQRGQQTYLFPIHLADEVRKKPNLLLRTDLLLFCLMIVLSLDSCTTRLLWNNSPFNRMV